MMDHGPKSIMQRVSIVDVLRKIKLLTKGKNSCAFPVSSTPTTVSLDCKWIQSNAEDFRSSGNPPAVLLRDRLVAWIAIYIIHALILEFVTDRLIDVAITFTFDDDVI